MSMLCLLQKLVRVASVVFKGGCCKSLTGMADVLSNVEAVNRDTNLESPSSGTAVDCDIYSLYSSCPTCLC